MKLRMRFMIMFFSIIFISLFFLGMIIFKNSQWILTQNTLNHLNTLIVLLESRIDESYARYFEHLRIAAKRTVLARTFAAYDADQSQAHKDEIENVLKDFLPVRDDLEEMYLFDQQGQLIAGSDSRWDNINVLHENFFTQGLKGEFHDFRRRNAQDKYAGQLFLSTAFIPTGEVRGVVLITLNHDFLAAITESNLKIGASEDVLVGRKNADGDGEFIAPRRFDNDPDALHIIPKNRIDIPMTQALAGQETYFDRAVDYRGHLVMAATKYLDLFQIGLVVKIDRDEFLKPVGELNRIVVVFGGIIVFFTSLMAFIIAQSLSSPIEKLSHSANDISSGKLGVDFEFNDGGETDEVSILARSLQLMSDKILLSNKNLENDVRIRTQELEKRLAEVEQFSRVAKGRELRMIELKKRINALSKELGLNEPYDLSFLNEGKNE